jgi:hypothetical protein
MADTALLDFGYQAPDAVWALPPTERSPRNTPDFAELGEARAGRSRGGLLAARGRLRGLTPAPFGGPTLRA